MKVIIYGSDICGNCLDTKAYLKEHADDSIQYNYFDITKSTANLKRFLKLRDTMDLFEEVRNGHTIGIPLFQFEDGTYTLDPEEAYKKMEI